MDKMVISACNIHMEELMEGNFSFDPQVPLSHGRVLDIETKKFFIHNKPKTILPIKLKSNLYGSKDLAESVGFKGE